TSTTHSSTRSPTKARARPRGRSTSASTSCSTSRWAATGAARRASTKPRSPRGCRSTTSASSTWCSDGRARGDAADMGEVTRGTPAERRMRTMRLPPLHDADAHVIERFLDGLWAEHGLARASLDSYRRDLQGFARWRDRSDGGLSGAERADLYDYLKWRAGQGYSPRSNARLLSALRAFYAACVRR